MIAAVDQQDRDIQDQGKMIRRIRSRQAWPKSKHAETLANNGMLQLIPDYHDSLLMESVKNI